ncbi:hypothetical protein B484DRAFT_393483 [Ochromonadaceae sp. CCMP2298]|nr:hypothetical protein B484DRAFT_393483 [Ochromonadaceae sp. CCMP2298]
MLWVFAVLLLCLGGSLVLLAGGEEASQVEYKHSVKVFHYVLKHWGDSHSGLFPCGDIACEWVFGDKIKTVRDLLYFTDRKRDGVDTVSVAMYNIHSLWEHHRGTHPNRCELRANLSMAETEESRVRYGPLFDSSFKHFDGYSSTSPKSSVQRVYVETFLDPAEMQTALNFSSLIKGASYVASDCHNHDSANLDRDGGVRQLREAGLRVDGLGRCMHSNTGPEGVTLIKTRDSHLNLVLKRQAVGRYLFHMAFENSQEDGYVTEKPWDALLAGSVPVYLGDAPHLRAHLPHPLAAIFVADFADYAALGRYLQQLSQNESAYEAHRAWRSSYSQQQHRDKPLLRYSWECRVCQWAAQTSNVAGEARTHFEVHANGSATVTAPSGHHHYCNAESGAAPLKAPQWEKRVVRGKSQRQIYLVEGGVLRAIPDMDTFTSLGFALDAVLVVGDQEVDAVLVGPPMPRAS